MPRYASSEDTGSSASIPVGVPILLKAEEVNPSRNTWEGKDEPQIALKWNTPEGAWIFDRLNPLHIRDRQDGTPSKAKQLAAALAGRIAAQVREVWLDDETFEYGFDGAKVEVAGRFQPGMQVAAELVRRPDQQGIERLRVSRYLPVSMAITSQEAGVEKAVNEMVSPDGRFRWDGQSWVPVAAGATAAPTPTSGGRLI